MSIYDSVPIYTGINACVSIVCGKRSSGTESRHVFVTFSTPYVRELIPAGLDFAVEANLNKIQCAVHFELEDFRDIVSTMVDTLEKFDKRDSAPPADPFHEAQMRDEL